MSKPSVKKFKKIKARDKEVAAKKLRERTAKRVADKLAYAEELKKKAWENKMDFETGYRKAVPYRRDATPTEAQMGEGAAASVLVREKLEHNLKLLQALEEEYQAEQKSRRDANEGLESEGAISMREKMDLLQKKLHDGHGLNAQIDLTGLGAQAIPGELLERASEALINPRQPGVVEGSCTISKRKK